MLDIFVVAIMAALFDFGGLAKITAGTGATAFALAVMFTMVAAMTFDARLIWDAQEFGAQQQQPLPEAKETW
jgi:paraquat-inducible protein A